MPEDLKKVPCCPELMKDDNCDVLFFTRTLPYKLQQDKRVVQLILGFKFTRCTKGLTLGDPVYTTTLLPGEKVRLVTSDLRSKFTYDKATEVTSRSEQMSEEQYFMDASQSYFMEQESQQSGTQTTKDSSNWDFHGDAEGGLGWFSVSASSNARGSHNSSSALDYLNKQSANMRSAATQAVHATHQAHSLSISEVRSRTHIEGSAESHFEACSREFKNENHGYAVSYMFYRINKKQVLRFELFSLAVTSYLGNEPKATVTPAGTATKATTASKKTAAAAAMKTSATVKMNLAVAPQAAFQADPELSANAHRILIDKAKKELSDVGILDNKGELSREYKKIFDFEMEFSLPTPGIMVKGCLDECNTLETEMVRYYKLQNDLLEKKIGLLDQAQEYRCCPPSPTYNNM